LPNVNFNEFYINEAPFGINVNIFISDDILRNQSGLLESLSSAFAEIPYRVIYHNSKVLFIKTNAFEQLTAERYKGNAMYELEVNVRGLIAHTFVELIEKMTNADILEEVKNYFCDDADVRGEEND